MQQPMTIWALAGEDAGSTAGEGAEAPWSMTISSPALSWQDMAAAGLAQAPVAPSVSMAMTPNRAMMKDSPRTRPN